MVERASDAPRRQRSQASFFSSVASFSLPPGQNVRPGSVAGYYIDLRVKVNTPSWPPAGARPPQNWGRVAVMQWGLAAFERYLAGEGEEWLAAAIGCAEDILDTQRKDGPLAGSWMYDEPLPHTFLLRPPWASAMAQGQGASLLVRLFAETREQRFADAARLALRPLAVDARDGGVRAWLDGQPYPEEYPSNPPSFVLNGGMFASWGLYDVGVGLQEQATLAEFEHFVDTLASNVHRWDHGYWSTYDLYPHPVPNVASSFYHDLHVTQLRMMNRLAPRPELEQMADRWAAYATSSYCRTRAFGSKALFRLIAPRNRLLAGRLPWSPLARAGDHA